MAITSIKTGSSFTNLKKYNDFLAGNAAYIPSDYESIVTANGTGSASSITFSNIPQTYQHLQLRVTARTTFANNTDTMYAYNFNNSTSSTNSAVHFLYSNGSSALANSATGNFSSIIGYVPANSALANTYGIAVIDFLDYSNTNKNKTIRGSWGWDDNGNTVQDTYFGLLSALPVAVGTNAITTMTIVFNGNITSASSFALYGIKG
jgi:hypothetical protein